MLTFDKDWVLSGSFPELSLGKWQKTVDIMARVFRAPIGTICQYYGGDGYQVVIASDQETNPYTAGEMTPAADKLFCNKVVRLQQPVYVNHASEDPEWHDSPEVLDGKYESYLGLPISWPDGSPFGTISVRDYRPTDYDNTYQALLEQFRDMVQADLAMLEHMRKLEDMTLRDDLSGLLNRRGLYMECERQITLAKRCQQSFGIMFIDLDDLKLLNDKYGHCSGDLAITAVGQAISGVIRESDTAGRVGGDEFAALLFVKSERDLTILSRRIKTALRAITQDTSFKSVNISCGTVFFQRAPDMTIDDMIHLADQAMYKRKLASKAG